MIIQLLAGVLVNISTAGAVWNRNTGAQISLIQARNGIPTCSKCDFTVRGYINEMTVPDPIYFI